ncbi:MAG: hypothetical protein C4570_07495 [Ammonifex sp.]|jgi:hypothetical protein|nr:MAG: hypothetical protein C4570_07495 [Ammonifex sp.]
MSDNMSIEWNDWKDGKDGKGKHFKDFEVICIETFKVYDFCFQAESREQCFNLPDNCPSFPFPAGSTANCEIVDSPTCTEISRTAPDETGRSNVTFAVSTTIKIIIVGPECEVLCVFKKTINFTKTVVLCAPDGTFTDCAIVDSACQCVLIGEQVCCSVDLCIVIQSRAVVKLLIPSFGFCVPKECEQVSPAPPLVCPPVLFPPQCTPLD